MAIADDFTITYNAGDYDIRHSANTNTYSVLELHRWLQDLADQEAFSGNDEVDITSPNPSERSTDNIITLQNGFNINDEASEYFYDGSITQEGGDTVYSGLVVVGSVNRSTVLKVIQAHGDPTVAGEAFYDDQAAPFWTTITDNRTVAADNILLRALIKTRTNGCDIDGKRVRVHAREYLDTYAEFSVTLGLGNSTAAIFTNDDLNNDLATGTIGTWTEITNDLEGYDAGTIDVDDDGTDEPYYHQWTVSTDPSGGDGNINDIYQWAKYITRDNTSTTIAGMNGELFRGISHYFSHTGTDTWAAANDIVAWGTLVVVSSWSGTIDAGYAIVEDTATPQWYGRVLGSDGSANLVVLVESGTVETTDTFTTYDLTGTAQGTGTVNGTPTAVTGGGTAKILAIDTTGDDTWLQLLSGTAPVDTTILYDCATNPGTSLTAANTIVVSGSVSTSSILPCFLGTSTGSNLIAGYGIGVVTATGDADFRPSVGDQFFPLDDTGPVLPADIRTFTVGNLLYVGAGDGARVLVGPKDTGNAFNINQFTNDGPYAGAESTVTIETGAGAGDLTAIPSDTPSTGTFRMEGDDGVYHRVTYTGKTTTTFTGCTGTPAASDDNNLFISYIDDIYDENAGDTGNELDYSARYTSARSLYVRVRYGGASSPLKQFESASTYPGSISAVQTSDA